MKVVKVSDLLMEQDESCRAFAYFYPNWRFVSDNCGRLDVVQQLRHGYQFGVVMYILTTTGISKKDLSAILHVSTRQLNRYEEQDLLPAEVSGAIYEFSRIYARGVDIFGDQETFQRWLNRPQLALGEQVPLSLLDTSEGIRMVNDLLSQIEFGFYS